MDHGTRRLALLLSLVLLFGLSAFATAHELYVLPQEAINESISEPSPNPVSALGEKNTRLLVAGMVGTGLLLLIVLFLFGTRLKHVYAALSISRTFSPAVLRVTLGTALMASSLNGALYGPELPFSVLEGPVAVRYVTGLIGVLLLAGFMTRVAALASVLLFVAMAGFHGLYLASYLSYFGASLFLLGNGTTILSVDSFTDIPIELDRLDPLQGHSGMFIVRVFFGFSLLASALHAKFVHSNLALATIEKFGLAEAMSLDPLFIVVGALSVESLIALAFIAGVGIRIVSLLLGGFMTYSLIMFAEPLWPHIILYGTAASIFLHGYDPYTLVDWWRERRS